MKRIIYTLVGMMLSIGCWADNVAKIDGTEYESLQGAINAATAGQTVQLISDVQLADWLSVKCSDVTLDLNGYTISPTADHEKINYCIILVHRGAKLTIDDTSSDKNGCIDGGTGANAYYGGILLTKNDDAGDAAATLVVNNGTIKGEQAAITGNGNRHNTNVTINGGTFTATSTVAGSEGCAIYHPQVGTLTINGGTFTGYASAVEIRSGKLNISGGSFTATATDYSVKANGNGTSTIGSAIAIAQHTTKKDIDVTISGGTFSGVKAVSEANPQGNAEPQISLAVTGGTFTGEISAEDVNKFISGGTFSSAVSEDVCKAGFVPTKKSDGTYGVLAGSYVAQIGDVKYATLAEAVEAATAGQTITLLGDITLAQRVEPNRNMTIDLGGYTITTTATCGNGSAFDVKSGNVTIKNGTIDGTQVTATECDAITARSGSNVTLQDLNITVNSKNGACAYAFSDSKITIKSGVYENQTTETYQYNANIKAMLVNQANEETQLIFIEGGTFKGYDPTLGDDSQTTNENATFLAEGVALQKDASGNYVTTTAVAKIGGKNYASIKDALAAATSGSTITLLADINEAAENTNANNFTIDLNGKTWTSDATSTFKNDGGTVTITDATGNGTIKNTANAEDKGIAVWARTGSVIIENGTFINQSNYEATLYVGTTAANLGDKKPTIAVKDGTFKNEATGQYHWKNELLPLTLNVNNDVKTYQAISISGGTFYGNDPALGDDNLGTGVAGGNFLADDYVAEDKGDGTFGVRPGVFVAKIGDKKYESLADAVAAATDGQTITLLADVNEAVTNENTNNFTIDLNGKNWTSSGDAFKNNGGTVTFTGEGLVKSTATDGIAVWARTGNIIINGGNYENCSNEEATVYVGTKNDLLEGKQPSVTINGGTFKNTAEGVYKWNTNLLPLTLNVHNDISNADAYQAIVINGGTFYGDDPSIGDDSQLNKINKNSNFVSPELHAEKNSDGVFEIKEGGYVAQVGYLKYVTLAEAAAIADDKTITLLADATIETIDVVAGKTIAKNGYEITVNTFEVIDFATFNIPFDFTANTATYTRNVAGNEWGTVCVPFTLKSTEAIKLYAFGNISDDVLTVNEVETVDPGTPIIFANTAKATSVTFTTENASVSPTAPATTGTLVGTYEEKKITEDLPGYIYYINGDQFHQAQASLTVPAYRAYINYSTSGAKPRVLSLLVGDADATAIEAVSSSISAATAIYDASGRKLSAPQKGLNIIKLADGKTVKLLIK